MTKGDKNPVDLISNTQLNWTLAFLSMVALPFINDIPLWPVILLLVTVVWRWWLHQSNRKVPHGIVRFLWTLLNSAFVLVTFKSFNGLEPGSSLLVIMAAMKLTESVRVRDLIVLIYMSFFLILANFLFDQSLLSVLYSVVAAWVGVTALSQVNRESSPDQPLTAFRESSRLLLQALPLALVFFFLFPRVPGPFWSLPSFEQGQTGLSDSMQPGDISKLLQSSEVAFRVSFDDQVPPRSDLYWRGPVLENVANRIWTREEAQTEVVDLKLRGQRYQYDMVLEAHNQNWLLALDMPAPDDLPVFAILQTSGQLTTSSRIYERRQISLSAYTDYVMAPSLGSHQRSINLNAAATENPKTRDLAARWRNTVTSDQQLIDLALRYFNQEPFVYTLSPPRILGNNVADEFLFGTRRGFCEHYASSFTLLMRYAGVPARVVTGYLGGEFNPINSHYTVRQSDAHAWAEVWLNERGWVRVDPTSAVAPERIEVGISAALPLGEALPSFIMSNNQLMRRMRQTFDAINANWNHWILGYGQERQWELLSKLGLAKPDTARLALIMALVAITVMTLFGLWLGLQSRVVEQDQLRRLYGRFLRRLNRLGMQTPQYEDALALSSRAAQVLPNYSDRIRTFCLAYQNARYGPGADANNSKQLRQLLRTIPMSKLLARFETKFPRR